MNSANTLPAASRLAGERVAVIGYGSQGRAHALNLRDSGADVTIGLRPSGASWSRAEADGLSVKPVAEAAAGATLVALLTPDMGQPEILRSELLPNLGRGSCLLFAHGFTVHYDRVALPQDLDIVLVAPKGPGDLVRREYELGRGVPCLLAIHQDATGGAHPRAAAYAGGIGSARSGIIESTFAEETESDLFGEQVVLCGGVKELVKAGFDTLVEAGYQPEVAYFECMHELKLIVDLLYEGGLAKMHQFISETAKYGALAIGPRVIDDRSKANIRAILRDIQSGRFARSWIAECEAGKAHYEELLLADREHPIERVGRDLRARMQWLEAGGE
jgi:ketol-acid reductoisomerase